MARFYLFNALPKELRDCIWDMSIRDDEPAVHFFTIHKWDDPDCVVDPAKKVHATRHPYSALFWVGLAAPRGPGNGKLSWTNGNLSTYMEDSGLWTACKESRERMLKHFRPSETSPQLSKRMPVVWETVEDICNKPTASINMNFTRDNDEHQCLTIRPSTDLICLQLPENSKISYTMHSEFNWEAIGHFPSFRWYGHKRGWHSSYIMNVAVEYDPAWEAMDPQKYQSCPPSIRGSFINVGEIHGIENFWFIDYRLTRKYTDEPKDRERKMFHAGSLTFIEVLSGDAEWCCCPKELCSDECFSSGRWQTVRGAQYLVHDLEDYHADGFAEMAETPHQVVSETYYSNSYGVLACVDLELEGNLPTRDEWYDMNDERLN